MEKPIRLGPSQKAVFEYLKTAGPSTSQQVGDALYEKTSSCYHEGYRNPAFTRRNWAASLLAALLEKGLIAARDSGNEYIWFIQEEKP